MYRKVLPLSRILQIIGRQEWIRFGIRDRIIRFFSDPVNRSSYEFTIDFFGLKYKGDLKELIDWNVYFYGAYEKDGLKLMKHLLNNKPDPIFLDIGANTGVYSIFMSKFCKEVHAFEPAEKAIEALKTNIKINNIKNIFIHNIGLGERTGRLNLLVPLRYGTGNSSFVYNGPQNTESVEVDVVKGDEAVKKLNLKKIDLIKIDVEGFEKDVLAGLKETIKKYHPIIFMEITEFTKKNFPDIDKWNSVFGGYKIFNLVEHAPLFIFFSWLPYKLTKFDFSTLKSYGNILCLPE